MSEKSKIKADKRAEALRANLKRRPKPAKNNKKPVQKEEEKDKE